MAAIGLLCPDQADRERLALLAGEAGHMVRGAGALLEAVEILREDRPRLMLVVDGGGQDAATAVREMLRVAPLLPIVVALKERDADRAVALMRLGAAEVVAPPWTKEGLSACLAKSLRYQGTAFSVAPVAPLKRSAAVYGMVVLLFFGAALGTSSLRRREELSRQAQEKRLFWDLPYRHPAGMAFDGSDLWVADWFTQSLYAHARQDAAIRRLVHFTSETPIAVAFAGDGAWSVTASGTIVRHMKDAKLSVVERYRDVAPQTVGLAFDGLYLWTSDVKQRRLRKRLLDSTLSVVASYEYPGVEPTALVYDGKNLWSLDGVNRELLRHNLERPEEVTARLPLPEYQGGEYKPVGLAWDGEHFWTVGERLPRGSGPARLFQHASGGAVP
jgi:DNA-binding response OmpR family regulator